MSDFIDKFENVLPLVVLLIFLQQYIILWSLNLTQIDPDLTIFSGLLHKIRSIIEEQNKIDWTKCNETKPVNENWNCFRKLFIGVLDIVTPLKEIRVKQNTEPWMSIEILNLGIKRT
jgi:hypothetical protein